MAIEDLVTITGLRTELAIAAIKYKLDRSKYRLGNITMLDFLEREELYIIKSAETRMKINQFKLDKSNAHY